MRTFFCPYTGAQFDFDTFQSPNHGPNKPGRWSATNEPLDEVALTHVDYSAMATPEAKESMRLKYEEAVKGVRDQVGEDDAPAKPPKVKK